MVVGAKNKITLSGKKTTWYVAPDAEPGAAAEEHPIFWLSSWQWTTEDCRWRLTR